MAYIKDIFRSLSYRNVCPRKNEELGSIYESAGSLGLPAEGCFGTCADLGGLTLAFTDLLQNLREAGDEFVQVAEVETTVEDVFAVELAEVQNANATAAGRGARETILDLVVQAVVHLRANRFAHLLVRLRDDDLAVGANRELLVPDARVGAELEFEQRNSDGKTRRDGEHFFHIVLPLHGVGFVAKTRLGDFARALQLVDERRRLERKRAGGAHQGVAGLHRRVANGRLAGSDLFCETEDSRNFGILLGHWTISPLFC